jgi:predicted nucleic acid-binding protein
MKYVLDASVALAWVIPRPMTLKADALRDDYRNAIHELIAPSTFPAEIASGLTKAERQKLIPVGDGVHLLADILRTAPLPRFQVGANCRANGLPEPRLPSVCP